MLNNQCLRYYRKVKSNWASLHSWYQLYCKFLFYQWCLGMCIIVAVQHIVINDQLPDAWRIRILTARKLRKAIVFELAPVGTPGNMLEKVRNIILWMWSPWSTKYPSNVYHKLHKISLLGQNTLKPVLWSTKCWISFPRSKLHITRRVYWHNFEVDSIILAPNLKASSDCLHHFRFLGLLRFAPK